MSVYLDASALVSLFVTDAHSARAEAIVRAHASELIVSDFAVTEYCSVLARRVRTGALAAPDCDALFGEIDLWPEPRRVETRHADMVAATGLIRRRALGLRAPDALHIAIAQRENSQLATFDANMARAALQVGLVTLS